MSLYVICLLINSDSLLKKPFDNVFGIGIVYISPMPLTAVQISVEPCASSYNRVINPRLFVLINTITLHSYLAINVVVLPFAEIMSLTFSVEDIPLIPKAIGVVKNNLSTVCLYPGSQLPHSLVIIFNCCFAQMRPSCLTAS